MHVARLFEQTGSEPLAVPTDRLTEPIGLVPVPLSVVTRPVRGYAMSDCCPIGSAALGTGPARLPSALARLGSLGTGPARLPSALARLGYPRLDYLGSATLGADRYA